MSDDYIDLLLPRHYLELEPDRPGGSDHGTTIRLWQGEKPPGPRVELTRDDMFYGQPHSHSNPIGGNGGGPRHNLKGPRKGESRRHWILRVLPDDVDNRLRAGGHHDVANALTVSVWVEPLKEIDDRLAEAGV